MMQEIFNEIIQVVLKGHIQAVCLDVPTNKKGILSRTLFVYFIFHLLPVHHVPSLVVSVALVLIGRWRVVVVAMM